MKSLIGKLLIDKEMKLEIYSSTSHKHFVECNNEKSHLKRLQLIEDVKYHFD